MPLPSRVAVTLATLALLAGYPLHAQADPEAARFQRCSGPGRVTCVVDGDTIWYRGTKIRLSDINAPEVSQPACAAEAVLGARATRRLIELLNAGPFSLERDGRNVDRYGRLLRVVSRSGASLGGSLEIEGLAEHWQGRRGNWCTTDGSTAAR